MKSRRGASLVELLVVMSACASILTTSVVLVHRIMHVQSRTRSYLAAQRSALRLSDQFRRDVHQAKDLIANGLQGEIVLQLQLPETQTVEYSHAQGLVRRTLLAGDRVVAREEFSFPPDIELAIRQEGSPRRVILSITSSPSATADAIATPLHATPVDLQVEACLGRDLRLGRLSVEKEASK